MKNYFRSNAKTIATIAISVLLLSFFGLISLSTKASDSVFNFLLKDYAEFGIIANSINQTSDMETNFMAGTYNSGDFDNGNASDKTNTSGQILIGEYTGKLKFRGNPVVKIDKSIKEKTATVIKEIYSKSKDVVKKSNFKIEEKITDCNNFKIDVSNINENTIYTNIDFLINSFNKGNLQNGSLKIVKRAKQIIVLNSTEDKSFDLPRYNVKITDGNVKKEEIGSTVIWNFPEIPALDIKSDNMTATVIAPSAFVTISVTGEGWLVCDSVVKNTGEWHMISHSIPTPAPSRRPTLPPIKSPKPTPKKTSKPTPAPTVKTFTPSPSPTLKPIFTPLSTPTSAATSSPTLIPTASPLSTPVKIIPTAPTREKEDTAPPATIEISNPEVSTPAAPIIPSAGSHPTYSPLVYTFTPSPSPIPAITEIIMPTPVEIAPSATPIELSELPVDKVPLAAITPEPDKKHNVNKINKDVTTILNEKIPLASTVPETGDNAKVEIALVLLGVAFICIVLIIFFKKE